MSRARFEELCKDEFKKTTKIVEQVLLDAGVKRDEIREVVLVGGSTRIPKVRAMLAEMFPQTLLNKSVNPDEAVACGAAIQAAILNHDQHASIRDTILMDVTPLSIGIHLKGGITDVKIKRTYVDRLNKNVTKKFKHSNIFAHTFTFQEAVEKMT